MLLLVFIICRGEIAATISTTILVLKGPVVRCATDDRLEAEIHHLLLVVIVVENIRRVDIIGCRVCAGDDTIIALGHHTASWRRVDHIIG